MTAQPQPEPEARPVSRPELESLLASIENSCLDPRAGIFGPDSITWTLSRESAVFLGAGRAALLQLAHPWVAAALAQHSSLLSRPVARFHNTFRIVFTMIFGSLRQATAAARHLHTLHTRIQGELPERVAGWPSGTHYAANEIAALRWVYATLVESAVLACEWILPLTPSDREAYYRESHTMAALFGLPSSALAASWTSFQDYTRSMTESAQLGVSPAARSMAHAILSGSGSRIHPPHWYRATTTAWLPERFREEFDLTSTPADQRLVERARRWFSRVYLALPASVRFVGPYLEARSRLAGRAPGWLTRRSNGFWIGQATLPFAD
jgi:uncharacterized protein (DUF2236 family)